jgi:hypothetical protein
MRMPSRLAEHIVDFLGYGEKGGSVSTLEGFKPRQWRRVLPWLDSSGLALYFLRRIEDLRAHGVLPHVVLARLRQNLEDNLERTAALAEEMRAIHQRLAANAAEFAVLKGYSLVPEYCPSPALRHQCDLDYVVAPNHLHRASRVLHTMGYSRVRSSPAYTFTRRTGDLPTREEIYKPGLNYSVELHTSLWENDEVAGLQQLPEVLARRQFHRAAGLVFPALSPEDRFIYQCMHVLSHTLQFWIRMAWLYEIASFLVKPGVDASFWQLVEKRIDGREPVARAVHFVTLLASNLFGAEVAHLREDDYPAITLWVNEYGGEWALHDLPGSKLSLFLFREFMDEKQWQHLERQRLFPLHRPHAATQHSVWQAGRSLRAQFAEYRYAGQRLAFHVRETWRYLREKPEWHRRLQALQQAECCNQFEAVLR